jgi:hypothetical protein
MTAHCGEGSDTSEFESFDGGLSNSNCGENFGFNRCLADHRQCQDRRTCALRTIPEMIGAGRPLSQYATPAPCEDSNFDVLNELAAGCTARRRRVRTATLGAQVSRSARCSWTDGYAEDGCGPVGVPELEYLFGWSGQWGPIFIQPKGDPKCHRCVCA